MARTMTPAGTEWTVRRHVLLWRLRFRFPDLSAGDLGEVLLMLVLAPILGLVWLPIEAALLLVLSVVPILGRVLGLWGWRVTAVGDGRKLTWRVRGWGNAGGKVEQVTRALAQGQLPPPPGAPRLGDGDPDTTPWGDFDDSRDGGDGGGDGGDGGGGGGD